jgi:putative membrane protein
MIRFLISTAINLAANAIGLLVAAAVLDDMTVSGTAFVIAVLIFTGVEVLARPLLTQAAIRNVQALQGGTALVATFVGLVITNLVSDGLEITGATTWLLATLIVWAAALIATLILPIIFVKDAVEDRRD